MRDEGRRSEAVGTNLGGVLRCSFRHDDSVVGVGVRAVWCVGGRRECGCEGALAWLH